MRCEYCSKPFYKGESVDIGVGFMQVTEDEPSCDCYDIDECTNCGEELLIGEWENHVCEEEESV